MGIDRNAIRQAVYEQYEMVIGDNDPVLVFLAMHDLVIGSYQDHVWSLHQQELAKFQQVQDSGVEQIKKVLAETRENGKKTVDDLMKVYLQRFQQVQQESLQARQAENLRNEQVMLNLVYVFAGIGIITLLSVAGGIAFALL